MKVFYTDGSCSKNPGPGGFGVVQINGDIIQYSYSKSCSETTNNREELKAILHAMEIGLKDNEPIVIYSDSAYCVNMLNDWIWGWANKGWKNSKKEEVKNLDLVKRLYNNLNKDFFSCQIKKVNGHCGIPANELADALATGNKIKYQSIILKYSLIEENIIDEK